jgi:hypothetical protein
VARVSKKVARTAKKFATPTRRGTVLETKATEARFQRDEFIADTAAAGLGRHEQRSNGSHYGPFERIDVLVHPRAASLIRSLADSGLFGVTDSEVAERLLTESLRVMFPRAWK